MREEIRKLYDIVTRSGSSKILSFSSPHVFKALMMLHEQRYVSRATFCRELHIGEGATRTMILHLRHNGMVDSIRAGTYLTPKGKRFAVKFTDVIAAQCKVEPCGIAAEKHNHAFLVRNRAGTICNGMDQRDFAIMYGAKSTATLLFRNKRFVFPGETTDALGEEEKTKVVLLRELAPKEDDIVIIASSDDPFVAEVSAINSVLCTLAM